MSNNNSGASAGGVSICTILLVIFIVLKLTHLINWPWIWVLSPIWIPIVLLALGSIIIFLIAVLAEK